MTIVGMEFKKIRFYLSQIGKWFANFWWYEERVKVGLEKFVVNCKVLLTSVKFMGFYAWENWNLWDFKCFL